MKIAEALKFEAGFRTVFGRMGDPPAARHPHFDAEVHAARINTARRTQRWTELAQPLVRRPGRIYVDADTDAMYRRARGVVFEPHSATPIAELQPLAFYVTADGGLEFFERVPGLWSERVGRRAWAKAKQQKRAKR